MTPDPVHPNPEGLHFQWSTPLAATWYSHGHPHGTILCYPDDAVGAHCYVDDIGQTDREQIHSRINNN